MDGIKYSQFLEIISFINWEKIIRANSENSSFILDRFNSFKLSESQAWNYEQEFVWDGKLFEGAFYFSPFLLAGLQIKDTTIDYKSIYCSIADFCNGESKYGEFVSFVEVEGAFKYFIPSNKSNSQKLPLCFACRNYLSQGILIFLAEIISNKKGCREEALDIVTSFYEHELFVFSSLVEAYHNVKDTSGKDDIKRYLFDFVKSTDTYSLKYTSDKLGL